MKVFALVAARFASTLALSTLAASTLAAPAFAQNFLDPASLLHNSYVEVEGGDTFQGRTHTDIAATGLGTSSNSGSLSDGIFGGALVGFGLTKNIAFEGEGVYTRTHLSYPTQNPLFGTAGATRTYGGLGNVKLSLPITTPYSFHALSFGVSPYIAGGIGYGNVQYTGVNGSFSYQDNQDGFIWQTKAGIEFKVGPHFALDVGYRYLQSPNFTTPGAFHGVDYSGLVRTHVQVGTLGLKYNF